MSNGNGNLNGNPIDNLNINGNLNVDLNLFEHELSWINYMKNYMGN